MEKRVRRNKEKKLNFKPIGESLKKTRLNHKMTREELCQAIEIDPRYLTAIENEGQCPSLEVFYRLLTYFNLSADQFFYSSEIAKTNSIIKFERILPLMNENDLSILYTVADSLLKHEGSPNKNNLQIVKN